MREIERVRELLTEYQKTHELTGRRQNIIAEILGTNKTKVGTLDNINNNLITPFMEEFAAGKISTSAANEIAGLEPDAQQALYETYKATGSLIAVNDKAFAVCIVRRGRVIGYFGFRLIHKTALPEGNKVLLPRFWEPTKQK